MGPGESCGWDLGSILERTLRWKFIRLWIIGWKLCVRLKLLFLFFFVCVKSIKNQLTIFIFIISDGLQSSVKCKRNYALYSLPYKSSPTARPKTSVLMAHSNQSNSDKKNKKHTNENVYIYREGFVPPSRQMFYQVVLMRNKNISPVDTPSKNSLIKFDLKLMFLFLKWSVFVLSWSTCLHLHKTLRYVTLSIICKQIMNYIIQNFVCISSSIVANYV